MAKKTVSGGAISDINVTPMVDVMLVLLIIFMVVTPMLSKGVSVDKVKAMNPIAMQAADKEDAVLVSVTRETRRFLERLPAAEVSLQIIDESKAESVSPNPIDDLSDGGSAQKANHAAPVISQCLRHDNSPLR